MDIYIVGPEDDINSIADKYGVSVSRLIQENGLENPYNLVEGQALVITYPNQTHIVEDGESLSDIAGKYNVTIMQLLRNNSFLSDREHIFPGELLVISHNTTRRTAVAGYAYSFININILKRTLPYLTFLYVVNYQIVDKGEIVTYYDDSDIINMSISYATLPIMGISALSLRGEIEIEVLYSLLLSENYQDILINNMLNILQTSGYYGVNLFVDALNEINQNIYFALIEKISYSLRDRGYLFFITVNPSSEFINGNIPFQNINYSNINQLLYGGIFIRQLWGSYQGPPIPVTSVRWLKDFLNFIVPMVDPKRLYAEIPLLAYDWELPYSARNTPASCMTLDSAISLASDVGAVIQFDEDSQTIYFQYEKEDLLNMVDHIVWSIDARAFNAILQLVTDENLAGAAIWNVMAFNQQLWSVLVAQFDVIKLLPEP